MGEVLTAPVGSIQKFSTEDGPGIRTTVFLKGCPLNCVWCHNPELIDFRREIIRMPNSCIKCGYCIEVCPQDAIYVDEEEKINIHRDLCDGCMKCVDVCYANGLKSVAKDMTVDEILYEVEQDITFYENTGGGMTVSGGEMLSHYEFVSLLIDEAKKKSIDVCLDTSGYGDGNRLEDLVKRSNVHHILYDVKALDSDVHEKCTGMGNEIILGNLKRLAQNGEINEKIRIRMPLVSGLNDRWEMLEETAKFFKDHSLKKLTLLPYHDLGVSKKRNIGGTQEKFSPPSDEYVSKIRELFQNEGSMEVEVLGKL